MLSSCELAPASLVGLAITAAAGKRHRQQRCMTASLPRPQRVVLALVAHAIIAVSLEEGGSRVVASGSRAGLPLALYPALTGSFV